LGEGIKLHEIVKMQKEALVECFDSKRLLVDMLGKWTTQTFSRSLGYNPTSLVLAKGWLAWNFQSEEDEEKILSNRWSFGAWVLFMKHWITDFNPRLKRLDITSV